MALFKRKVKQLKASVLFVAGNHDVGIVGEGDVKTSITPEKVKLFSNELGPNWFGAEGGYGEGPGKPWIASRPSGARPARWNLRQAGRQATHQVQVRLIKLLEKG